jgi:hypothetical protein
MEISPLLLELLLKDAAELGAIAALVKVGKIKPYLKKSEAFKIHGRNKVERWLEAGLITPRKDGDYSAAWRLDRIELEVLSKSIKITQLITE